MTDQALYPSPYPREMTTEEFNAYPWPRLEVGDRVAIDGTPTGITLTSQTGTVTEVVPDHEHYYGVRLDAPARDWDTGESVETIWQYIYHLIPLPGTSFPDE